MIDAMSSTATKRKNHIYPKSNQSKKEGHKGLSLIQTCTIIAGTFCIIVMIVQLHVHSQVQLRNLDDDDGGSITINDVYQEEDTYHAMFRNAGRNKDGSSSDNVNRNMNTAVAHSAKNGNNANKSKKSPNALRVGTTNADANVKSKDGKSKRNNLPSPIVKPPSTIDTINCGCPHSCTKRALSKRNPQFKCIERILHMVNKKNVPELEACEAASQTTFNFNDTDSIDIRKPCEYECHPKICANMTITTNNDGNSNNQHTFLQDVTNLNLPKDGPFTKYEKVVIVTKVLSSENLDLLIQMLCLLHAAYNRFVLYDIIVFTTIPFTEEEIREVQDIVHPANVQVVTEGKSLEEQLDEMTQDEIDYLNKRCHVKDNETITWGHHCEEENTPHVFSLGYAWQAEFRSYHLWTHEALRPYKYMMWLDADAMCTKTWDSDPMKVMIDNDLILMYDQFPGGYVRGDVLKQKIKTAYGNDDVVCNVVLDEEKGILKKEYCETDDMVPSIKQVYGFHHITNLDVYRQENHQRFLKEMINNGYRFSRLWDDQLAVTLPAVMEDPSRCWDYRIHGLDMGIHHNGRIDGKEHPKYLSYLNFWAHDGKYKWPAARAMCDGLVTVIS